MTLLTIAEIEDEAARWVARMDGHWTYACEAELAGWLEADPRHQGAMLRAEAAWMTLDHPTEEVPSPRTHGVPTTRRRVLIGAGGALVASVAAGWLLPGGSKNYVTAMGEIRRVPLDDGSVATINTNSRIDIRLSSAQREVRIDEGEAWFQVMKDTGRPFVVEAGRTRVRAVGTAFSVRRRANGADILVTEGVVEAWANGAEGHRVRIKAGTAAFVADDAAIVVQPVEQSSVDRALAWRSGKIEMVGATLAEAAGDFNRYNRRSIEIADPDLAREAFDGTFRIDDPAGFASAVARSLDADVDLSNPSFIRISRRREQKSP